MPTTRGHPFCLRSFQITKYLALVVLVILAITPIAGESGSVDQEHYKNKMAANLWLASIWLVEEGVETFQKEGKKGIHRKLVDTWGVQIWTDPWIESERYIDGFWIKARGINHEVINFHRESVDSFHYEFWVVKVDGKDWSGVDSRARFYIARTDDIYGRREILETDDQFIEQYQLDNEAVIRFPTDNPQILYELQAWRYPDNFEHSDLKNISAEMNKDGSIRLTRISEK